MPYPSHIDVACTTADGTLTIGGILMHNPAFAVMDVTPLWEPPPHRGENLLIPGRSGKIPLVRVEDEGIYNLPMVIDGTTDVSGNFWENDREGLYKNMDYLYTYIASPAGGGGTRYCVLSSPSPSDPAPRTGYAHVTMQVGEKVGTIWRAVLTLTIPNGMLR
jgi:hypothetical protein